MDGRELESKVGSAQAKVSRRELLKQCSAGRAHAMKPIEATEGYMASHFTKRSAIAAKFEIELLGGKWSNRRNKAALISIPTAEDID